MRLGKVAGADVLPHEHQSDCAHDDTEIHLEAALVDILHVVGKLAAQFAETAAVHLREPGDAGAHLVAAAMFIAEYMGVVHRERARPDKAHVAFEYIDELGQLIERCRAHQASERRKALGVGQREPVRPAAVVHRLEFDEVEYLVVESDAFLTEEYSGASVGKMQADRDDEKDGARQYQTTARGNNITSSLAPGFIPVCHSIILYIFCASPPICRGGQISQQSHRAPPPPWPGALPARSACGSWPCIAHRHRDAAR